jgi:endonuclease G, mitochondrial
MVSEAYAERLDSIVKARLQSNRAQISHSLRQIAAGNPLGAETDDERKVARLALKTGFDRRQAEALSESIRSTAEDIDRPTVTRAARPEAIWGTADFIGVEFFARGRRAANAVGRILFQSGRVQGTGFLVGPGLLLTNNHVIESAVVAVSMCVQFDFEVDEGGLNRSSTVFTFDPARCFATAPVDGLDFTLIALGERTTGGGRLADFGYLPLSDAGDKHMLGEFANIIQHPEGRLKQIVLRDNNLVARDETAQVLHYIADTQPGSSGSPVLNNEWEPIALHHWAGPHLETKTVNGRKLRVDVNEGIRISAIVQALREGRLVREARTRESVAELLRLWDGSQLDGPVGPRGAQERTNGGAMGGRSNADGSVSWVFPIEINVRAPLLGGVAGDAPAGVPLPPPASGLERRDEPEDFSDRGGYEPGFIPGFNVPLPDFSNVGYRIARNQESTNDDDAFELRYNHFSVVLNAERRLASFTACNIDGARIKAVNRQTKVVTDNPTLKQLDAEAFGPEATDAFRPDSRVLPEEQMTREFYEEQQVPGFDKPTFPGKNASAAKKQAYYRAMNERTARMLQKGHIVLRGDPAWGSDDEALSAESDTFHYTNAAPQLGFFNQGSRDDHPGEKGKLRWRTVETYVLRNAVTTRQRICVFAGPVFRNDDPDYRFGSKLPMRFWKIAVWAEDGDLRSVAVLADQKEVLDQLTQGVPEAFGPMHGAEAFDDLDELARVSQFLTTVAEIERLTGLKFANAVRAGDVRAGDERLAITEAQDFLHPRRLRSRRPRPRRPRGRAKR